MTVLLPLLLAAGVVPAAATPTGDCNAVDNESVLARDVAHFVPAFGQLPGEFLIGYVEASGAPKTFRGADLERLARTRGVELHGLEDLCLERRMFIVPADRIAAAMREAIGNSGNTNLKVEISTSSQQPVPTGEVVFPRGGVQPGAAPEVMWRGYVQSGNGAKYPIWARARIALSVNRVIAATELLAGKPIQKDQIRVESGEESPFEDGFIGAAEEAVGLVPKMTIQKGSSLRKSQVAPPVDVARGDLVRVDVFAGNAHLSMEARAETSGMKGSTITVRNLSTGKDFPARVAGKGQVTVGGQAE